MPDLPPFDPDELLRRLVAAGVDFVVVGGLAVALQGYERFTKDLDIAFAADHANLRVLGAVLTELDARLFGIEEDVPFVADEQTLDRVQLLTLRTSAGRLDVHKTLDGVSGYAALRRRADRMEANGVTILVASVDDLLAMKHAAGRGQDQVDIAALQEIKKQRRRKRGGASP